jgi:hypothetical protein
VGAAGGIYRRSLARIVMWEAKLPSIVNVSESRHRLYEGPRSEQKI